MGDDIDSFFAKKKAKQANKKKKVGVQDVQVLAQQLEQTVREQEELDKLEEQEKEMLIEEESSANRVPGKPKQQNEDSEWIEYTEQTVDLDKLNVKDYEQEESDHLESDTEEVIVQHKTWSHLETKDKKSKNDDSSSDEDDETTNNSSSKDVVASKEGSPAENKENEGESKELAKDAEATTEIKESSGGDAKQPDETDADAGDTTKKDDEKPAEPAAPSAYVPPGRREGATPSAGATPGRRPGWAKIVAPNLGDEMQFPTLGDADTIAEEMDKKQKKVAPAVPSQSSGGGGSKSLAGETWSIAGSGRQQPQAAPAPPTPGKYVPPSRRNADVDTSNRYAGLRGT